MQRTLDLVVTWNILGVGLWLTQGCIRFIVHILSGGR